MYRFNINNDVWIELKENSIDIIKSKISGDAGFKEDYIKHCITPHIVEMDGKKYLEIQLWQVMNFFGDKLSLGLDLPIGTDIMFSESKCIDDNANRRKI